MTNTKNAPNDFSVSDRATLDILDAIEAGSAPSQRSLSKRIGIALGLTNGIVKRAARKGMIKIKAAPAKRYAYYITPKGFSEKSRLIAEYLSASLSFFRKAREEYEELFASLVARGRNSAVLYGAGELAEIAVISAWQAEIEIQGVISIGENQSRMLGFPVFSSIEAALAAGCRDIVVTDSIAPQRALDTLANLISQDCIHVVPLLKTRNRN